MKKTLIKNHDFHTEELADLIGPLEPLGGSLETQMVWIAGVSRTTIIFTISIFIIVHT